MDEAVRIAFEAGLPYTGLRDFRPDERLWRLVDPGRARRAGVVPLLVVGDRLKVAAARPDPDLSGLDGGCAGVDVVIAPAAEIDAVLAGLPARDGDDGPAAHREPVTDPARPHRIGDLLVAHGLTTDATIAAGLGEQARSGGLLGEVLVAREAVSEEALRAVLAAQLGLPLVDLTGYQPDPEALARVPELLQRRLRCVPLAVDGAAVYVALADPLDAAGLDTLRTGAGGLEPRCFLAARADVDELLQALHGEVWAAMAHTAVSARFPVESCGRPVRRGIVAGALALLAAATAGLAVAPATTAVVLLAASAVALAGPALLALPVALLGLARRDRPARDVSSEGPLPLTTLLLPLAGGSGAAVDAATTLAALGHPTARLEVLLLCPAHDPAGIRAARELARRPGHRVAVVPPAAGPGRAAVLSYGLLLARGDHVAVLDPGAVPAADLLEVAGHVLRAGGPRLAAVQAVQAPPAGGGLLAAWLAGECAAWHVLVAPGLARLGLPLPLATTGLVARREALEECGGWDPACAAEGVDLGLRLHKCGFRARPVASAVAISGPSSPGGWIDAHARWWDGALRAWLVQLRHPWRAIRRMGPAGAAATALLGLGGVVAPLLWTPVLAVAALGALQALGATGRLLPETVVRLAGGQVLAVSAVLVGLGVAGAVRRRSAGAAIAALLAPVAFVLVSLGAWVGAAGVVAGDGRLRDVG
jgi:hypothetical protein